MQFIGMRYEEAAERWPSAAAREQHSSWRKNITWETCYRAVSCKALL